jgi:aspartate aminotransferase-like enzyme
LGSRNLVWALAESVRLIKEEGLENRFARHRKTAKAVQSAMEALGFRLLAKEGLRAVTLSNLIYPDGIVDAEFRSALLAEGVVVAGGLAAYAGKMFRLGHMGNLEQHDLVAAVSAIERVLVKLGHKVKYGHGVEVLTKGLE